MHNNCEGEAEAADRPVGRSVRVDPRQLVRPRLSGAHVEERQKSHVEGPEVLRRLLPKHRRADHRACTWGRRFDSGSRMHVSGGCPMAGITGHSHAEERTTTEALHNQRRWRAVLVLDPPPALLTRGEPLSQHARLVHGRPHAPKTGGRGSHAPTVTTTGQP